MISFPQSMQRLIRELTKLPSIGEKSASRLAYHLINNDKGLAYSLAEALRNSVENIRFCEQCFFMTDSELCTICRTPDRDASLLCVVEKPMDLIAMERGGDFRGYYHVLHGLWAPLRGQGPESMRLTELLERIERGHINEVILATSSTVEGDATALYIARLLRERGVLASRLAQGIPKGGELEYADDLTLSRALSGRSPIAG